MIILNAKNVKSNFKEMLDQYYETLNFTNISCPNCSSNDFINWGYYERNVYYINNKYIIYDRIKIKRIKCKLCGHTHAILPSFIIPYKQSMLDVILCSIEKNNIIYKYNFSEDTITYWNKQFRMFLPYLKTMFNNHNTQNIIFLIKNDIFGVYEKFYLMNKKILMMVHSGILNMAYF